MDPMSYPQLTSHAYERLAELTVSDKNEMGIRRIGRQVGKGVEQELLILDGLEACHRSDDDRIAGNSQLLAQRACPRSGSEGVYIDAVRQDPYSGALHAHLQFDKVRERS
jgi:hypothetical protein